MRRLKMITGLRWDAAIVCGVICSVFAVGADAGQRHHSTTTSSTQVQISGVPATTDASGHTYDFTPTASVPTGYTKTFSISGKPTWATFNSSTGELTGTPTEVNVGTYSSIIITVSDGVSTASLAPFSITVTNTAPTIAGVPAATVNVGSAYSFTPVASDANGDALTFSVQNLPAWASFNATTGQLTGTPSSVYAGTFSNIVISVSDGLTATSLAPFSITVTSIASGSATLSWTLPTSNVDGSTVTDLAGYRIYYGPSTTSLTQTIDISDPTLLAYTINNLASGTWYFGVTAYTSSGSQSALSNLGSKAIP